MKDGNSWRKEARGEKIKMQGHLIEASPSYNSYFINIIFFVSEYEPACNL